jgi:Transposase
VYHEDASTRSFRRREPSSSPSVGLISEANPVRAAFADPTKAWSKSAITIALAREGWQIWEEKLNQLDAPAGQILIGMEAISRDAGKSLSRVGAARVCAASLTSRTNPSRITQQRGLRAKTDRLDAMTIARTLLSGEARMGYVPSEQVATYRELVRLHTQLSDTAASYQNEIQALLVVLFPEFTQVFADPCLPTALSVRNRLPKCSGPGRSGCRSPLPGVTSTANSTLRTPYRKETGGPGQSEREQWAGKSRTIDQSADSLRSTGAHPGQSCASER